MSRLMRVLSTLVSINHLTSIFLSDYPSTIPHLCFILVLRSLPFIPRRLLEHLCLTLERDRLLLLLSLRANKLHLHQEDL